MGRRRKILGLVLAMVLYAQEGMLFNAYGQESQVMDQEEERIEQVYGNLPEVVMYASGLETADVQEAEAYLAGEKLSLINTGVFSEKMPDGKGLLNCEQFVTIQTTSQ